jgi:hypothetical protein
VLYQWLTAEPEPEVIVIDLRDSYTVGPILAILDRIAQRLIPLMQSSQSFQYLTDLADIVARVVDSQIGEQVMSLLEPPAPPEQDDNEKQRADHDPDS